MGRLHIYLHEWCICVVNDQVNIYHHPMNPMEFWCGFQCELLSHLCGLCRNGTSVEDKMKQPGRKTSTSTSLCSKMWENTGKTTCFTKLLADVFSRRDSEMMEKNEWSYCCYSVVFGAGHPCVENSQLVRFQNLKFLLARATIPSSTGFTPNICSSIIAWLLTRSLAPRCGGDVSRERTCGPWNKSLNGLYIFPTKYVIPKSFKSNHWPNSILFAGTKKSWR